MPSMLRLRREAWEFALLPPLLQLLPRLDSIATLQALRDRLSAASSGAPHWEISVAAAADVLGLSEDTLRIIFETVAAVAPGEGPLPPVAEPGLAAPGCDVFALISFLFMQLYLRHHTQEQRRESSHAVWPAEGHAGPAPHASHAEGSPLSSPSSKAHGRVAAPTDDGAQLAFALRHLPALLSLLRDARGPAPPGGLVSTFEFDRLRWLLAPAPPPDGDEGMAVPPTLSALCPVFGAGAQTAPAGPLADWLARVVGPAVDPARGSAVDLAAEAQVEVVRSSSSSGSGSSGNGNGAANGAGGTASPGGPGPSNGGRVYSVPGGSLCIEGVTRGTVVQRGPERGSRPGGGTLRVADCHDAAVYILAPLRHAAVSHCSDLTLVMGAVGRLLLVESCERLTLVAACRILRVAACHGSRLYLATPCGPVLLGENRGLQLAPFNTSYDALDAHLAAAGLPAGGPNLWDSPRQLGAGGGMRQESGLEGAAGGGVALLPPAQFLPFTVPVRASSDAAAGPAGTPSIAAPPSPFPLPPAYAAALEAKVAGVTELRRAVREAALDDGRRRELQAAIQGHFKEWLAATGHLREIFDLARIERGQT